MTKGLFLLGLSLLTTSAWASETARGSSWIPMDQSRRYDPSRMNQNPVMTSQEMACILEKVSWKPETARKSSEAINQALMLMREDSHKFTRTSLLHFLAQITAESGKGEHWVELKPKSPAVTGYGPLQVTGKANLKQASECMNEMRSKPPPPLGARVVSAPRETVGNPGEPLYGAAASLCWWKRNMIENRRHVKIVNEASDSAARKVHQIVNAGHIGGKVTGGRMEMNERAEYFQRIQAGERQCRQG